MYPSIKRIMDCLKLDKVQARQLRIAMEHNTGLDYYNRLIGAYGQESIYLPDGCCDRCEEPDVRIAYVNRGDTYTITLLKVNGQYKLGSWGDVVEAYDNKH
jgi:hypothetical protein